VYQLDAGSLFKYISTGEFGKSGLDQIIFVADLLSVLPAIGDVISTSLKFEFHHALPTITVVSHIIVSSIISDIFRLYVPDFLISNHFENSFIH